jgi:hypothetical protein
MTNEIDVSRFEGPNRRSYGASLAATFEPRPDKRHRAPAGQTAVPFRPPFPMYLSETERGLK